MCQVKSRLDLKQIICVMTVTNLRNIRQMSPFNLFSPYFCLEETIEIFREVICSPLPMAVHRIQLSVSLTDRYGLTRLLIKLKRDC